MQALSLLGMTWMHLTASLDPNPWRQAMITHRPPEAVVRVK